MYSPWCDDEGKVVDDGTIQRLEENRFRVTAADPNLRWFQDCGEGMEASVADISADLAALALQGPLAQDVLASLTQGVDLEDLKYFHLAEGEIGAIPATITRTGYTGDLGYELWVKTEDALPLWEALIRNEAGYNLTPTGLAALDMARIEAGLLLIEVDFISTHKALIEDQRSSPYEIGLGWTVALDKGDFIGRRALLADKEDGVRWKLVGLEVSWTALETLFGAVDLPPQVTGRASRSPLPVYKNGLQIGQVTSSTFSPILKKYIALASLERPFATLGSQVDVEVTVEYGRRLAQSQVVPTPFYDPPQKRA
jgi:aminomethyltransferase